jgi:hypothetical protein
MKVLVLLLVGFALAVDLDAPPWTLIQNAGFQVENVSVATRDGYLLSVQRIPCKGCPVVCCLLVFVFS